VENLRQGLEKAVEKWDRLGWPRPQAMLVSGSGLAVDLGDPSDRRLPLAEWLPFPTHHVEGHPLVTQLLTNSAGGAVLYQQGRLHSYQGYDAHQTVFSIRLGALLGAHTLVMTNAAGGLRRDQRPGDLVLIRDHINLIGLNSLRGDLPEDWGPRFPDMTLAYDSGLRELSRELAGELGIRMGSGIYAALAGPSYETPAEVEMLRRAGADLVGMSTALEVIAARHMGVRCLGISVVTNLASGVAAGVTSHDEVLAAGQAAAGKLGSLLSALVQNPALYS
jgi:purine-nucleoside phosphorylase